MYTMMNGLNKAAAVVLPLLGKHPTEYPRFRDCWIGKVKDSATEVDSYGIPKKESDNDYNFVTIYTRIGGNNREVYQEQIDEMRANPLYIKDYDDSFDNTYASFIYRLPEKWIEDAKIMMTGNPKKVSKEYVDKLIEVMPERAELIIDACL